MTSKSLSYCFTINNWSDADLQELQKLEDNPRTRYLIVGREVGDEGTPHIQGYVYFHNQTVFSTVKKWLSRAHIQAARGSVDDNVAYCSKDGDFHESGDKPVCQKRKGERGNEYWEANKKLAKEGRLDEVDSKLFLTHYRTLKTIAADHKVMPPDNDTLNNFWYYGPTGTGKSKKAREDYPDAFIKRAHKWWCDYKNQEVVIIDDFDKTHAYLGYDLKIWGDHYAFPAEIKGGKIDLRPKTIVITSNWHPSEIWSDPQTLDPILRRYKIVHFPGSINDVL